MNLCVDGNHLLPLMYIIRLWLPSHRLVFRLWLLTGICLMRSLPYRL